MNHDDPTWWAWGVLVLVAIIVFVSSGAWWVSGHRGGSSDEAGPAAVTLAITAIVGALMWWAGWLP